LENHGHLIGYAEMPHIFEDESDRLELIEQAIGLTPSYAASYSQKNEKGQVKVKASTFLLLRDNKTRIRSVSTRVLPLPALALTYKAPSSESDRLELIEQAIGLTPSYAASYSQKNEKGQRSFRYKALIFIADVKRKLINEADFSKQMKDENIILLYCGYQDILKSQNAIDFDDLLLKVYGLFVDYPKIAALYRRSFSAICVDEAQDMNNAQYQLLKALANGEFNHILMVGDPNQSIFHFNGSSSNYMDKEFVKDFNPTIIELNENYRSSIAVLRAAQQLIPDASQQIEHTVKQGVFELYKVKNETSEAQWVVNKIQEISSLKNHDDIEGELNFEKIVVLARNKYLFKSLEEALQAANIPHYYKMTPGKASNCLLILLPSSMSDITRSIILF
jgi:DNA helicase-2/ATP-dependent DNA helicase PcrA